MVKKVQQSRSSTICLMVSPEFLGYTDNRVDDYVINAWRDILKSESISMDDNIFDLGVSSIEVTIFLEKTKECWGVTITTGSMYKLQTLRELAEYIGSQIKD